MRKERTKANRNILKGVVKRHPDGFGFFIPEDKDHPDVYIPKQNMKGVFTNDKVMVEAFPEGNGERFRGTVVEILEKGIQKVAGTLLRLNDTYGIIRDDTGSWGEDLKIPWTAAGNNAIGKLVTAQITQFPSEGKQFLGEVLEVLGDIADPMNDIKRVIAIQQIPDVFPQEALDQVKDLAKNPEEKEFAGRRDLRGKNLITIDGKTAKDFDDAVLVERLSSGFKLYVAIADVSHYVEIGTPVDQEAYLRGNSCYFPNFVVPMLPEVLSNHLCSLNPKVPRLCVVAEMDFDYQGIKTNAAFYEAVMESKARVTYGEAQEVIDGTDLPQFSHVKDNILLAADLAKIFMAKRQREGSLDLEIPETELIIDAKGEPVDVIRAERLFSHKLIEEMMLAANVAVAQFLSAQDIAALYRIHEPPFDDNVAKLQNFITNFGGDIKLDSGMLQKKLSQALHEFDGTPQAHAIHTLTLRSMNQAKYSSENLGHFGLGFEHYTHFTSPIRRYSDLVVHRLLKNQIMRGSKYELRSEEDLSTTGVHLSGCEQKAAKAERLIKAIKKARFLGRFIGEEFEGMISSVTKFGVFVVLRQYDIDGLIRLEDLSKEHLEYDEENMILSGKRSGVKFQIGDMIKIVVSSVDIELGQTNFVPHDFVKSASRDSEGRGRRNEKPSYGGKESRRGGGGRSNDRATRGSGGGDRPPTRNAGSSRSSREETTTDKPAGRRSSKKSSRPSGQKNRGGFADQNQNAKPFTEEKRSGQDRRSSDRRGSDSRPQNSRVGLVNSRTGSPQFSSANNPRNNQGTWDRTKSGVTTPEATGGKREGLTPEQIEEKFRKLRQDPRFQGKADDTSFGDKPKAKSKNVFAKLKSKRNSGNQNKGQDRGSSSGESSGKDDQKRGSTKDDRRGVRKARISKRR